MIFRRAFVSIATHIFVATWALAFATTALAEAFPGGKPIHLVVATGVGSGSDLTARQIAAGMSKDIGAPVIVENKTGAGGVIGTHFVAKAPADGYTLLATYAQHYTNQLVRNTPYDAVQDFDPIARVANSALVISVATDSPYKTLADVVEEAKQNPGIITYGSSGNGTTSHMAAALFSSMAGISMNHIPYKAPGQVALDAASGQIDLSFNGMSSVLPLIKGGRLRPLAVTTATRSLSLPDVLTVAEQGFPGYEAASPVWIFAPHGTPQAVIDMLSEAVTRQAQSTEFKALCLQQGLEVDVQDAATAKAAGPGELEKWRKLMSVAGVKAD
ncbi:Bug family tripartite tricarboxylate transporter substrate binding protein [Allopusillimonas ginsengisoli]|uniref:Bug family tripartite tricarboxylate transporter substrate binding protein n=1 Tax=Allopusillimonas ginsengisoli TaxID=453575 RepID=UPI00101ECC92|nr:tripartite tricarboxylate transporter substrate binding protein [Allopusillimonas ginsengisoli]TEA71901.1 tripartite tricarboxylate transporter substrate binding protein [Allopusillimonas ginsengisoli]